MVRVISFRGVGRVGALPAGDRSGSRNGALPPGAAGGRSPQRWVGARGPSARPVVIAWARPATSAARRPPWRVVRRAAARGAVIRLTAPLVVKASRGRSVPDPSGRPIDQCCQRGASSSGVSGEAKWKGTERWAARRLPARSAATAAGWRGWWSASSPRYRLAVDQKHDH